ncbi:MerR family DNA-binding protein [Streptomyces canus]|uniref:MerR family DNA-binding protein n=1 Tax=Streptomyces canus TaxID=58343 RepID=UPI002E2A6B91|nr:MerR family DNA-binding protein [Streptomyces canus]
MPVTVAAAERLIRIGEVARGAGVGFFQQMFAAGLTSRRITELLACRDSGHTDAEQRAMLRAERERIQAKIDDLQAALAHLDEVIAITDTHP